MELSSTACIKQHPVRARALNDETFKSTVVELLKISSDTNHQRHYVGDCDGDVSLAGLGIPPISFTDGALPGAEMLFKQGLHSVKGLFDSQAYLKNPKSAEAEASRQQSAILESINHVVIVLLMVIRM